MCQHVCLEVSSLCGCVFTLLAAELLFTNMNKNVLFQLSSAAGRVGTHGASVDFLSSLLSFGLGCETHCAKLSGTLAASFRQLMLVMEILLFF